MSDTVSPTVPQSPAFDQAAQREYVENHAIATGPVWAALMPTTPVELPADLVTDARKYHQREMLMRGASRFKVQSFEDWIADIIRDSVYGPGADSGAAQDWLER